MPSMLLFVLAHLIYQGYNAEYTESEYANQGQRNGPGLAIIEALDEHHNTKNGDEDCNGKKWKFHVVDSLVQK
jgi:hypothetical protein